MTVTISISQRKATSVGVRPGGRGNAMADQGEWRYERKRNAVVVDNDAPTTSALHLRHGIPTSISVSQKKSKKFKEQ